MSGKILACFGALPTNSSQFPKRIGMLQPYSPSQPAVREIAALCSLDSQVRQARGVEEEPALGLHDSKYE